MGSCVFCDIVAGVAPAARVYEDDDVVAFLDARPVARGHVLVVPREHVSRLENLDPELGAAMFRAGQRLARALTRSSLPTEGTNLVLNDGRAAFQSVFHAHLHVLPRRKGDRIRLGVGLVRRRAHDPDATAAAIRAGLDRLASEEKNP